MDLQESPAAAASREALQQVYQCLDAGQSFLLEAGAGAGKTYSLIHALRYLIEKYGRDLPRHNRRIACITYTNVATEEIKSRIDKSPLVYCDTNHSFCWSLIGGFQKHLRSQLYEMDEWKDRIKEAGGLGERRVAYKLGFRSIREDEVLLHHNDILPLTISLMTKPKFRRLLADQFPFILIDEYQDTDADWIEAIKTHFLGQAGAPLFGFFGDHWQKIYGNGCGKLEHPAVKSIGKQANFRSVRPIVDTLSRMRPALPQFPEDQNSTGHISVFHTNRWNEPRQTANHWQGDLPAPAARRALEIARRKLIESGWDFSAGATKVLMLTHRVLAAEQGYSSLPDVFRYNEAFTNKENAYISFLVDVIEPACDAFDSRRYGEMFTAIGGGSTLMKGAPDKKAWSTAMKALTGLRQSGTVGQVIDHLKVTGMPCLPESIERLERDLASFDRTSTEEMPRALEEAEQLRKVSHSEIRHLRSYLLGHSPFETKHGVKGAEFENVLVVIGRGWNQYNFNEMLELASEHPIPARKLAAFERNRNLFYVACSRPKKRLALLFTQQLSASALGTLASWFGAPSIAELPAS